MGVHFINISKKSFLSDKPLFKMVPFDYVDTTLGAKSPYLWFANPATWQDAFEKRFIDTPYKVGKGSLVDFPLKNKVFCSCFSQVRTCESQWYMYNRGNKTGNQGCICLSINRQTLLQELENYCKSNVDTEVYIGKVIYQETKTIEGSLLKNEILNRFHPFSLYDKNSQIRMLLLKRNAYYYENEIRIFIVNGNSSTTNNGIQFNYSCKPTDLVERVILNDIFPQSKRLETQLCKPVSAGSAKKPCYGFDPIKNSLGRNQPRVVWSHLYSHKTPTFFIL